MTTATVATLPRLSATALSEILLDANKETSNLDALTPPKGVAIVDVRDDDHIGGHIRHSLHTPSTTLDTALPTLVRKLRDKETVVFHCALSQQRGPSAALRYIRERERLVGQGSVKLEQGSGVGSVLRKNAEDAAAKGKEGEEDGEWEDVNEEGNGKGRQQRVFVLDRGFVGWQERFGEDARLTEGYRKEIWKEGYWM